MPAREIQISSRCEALRFDPGAVRSWLLSLDSSPFVLPVGDLSIVFFTDTEMGDIHGTYLGDPSPTDVITFPGDPDFQEAGEICVGAERARDVHAAHGLSLSAEILLYLAHGWLHLAGYDDRSDEDRTAMRTAEQEALRHASGQVPAPVFEWIA